MIQSLLKAYKIKMTLIENIDTAHTIALAESPYRDLSLHARSLGLAALSVELEERAVKVGDEKQRELAQTTDNKEKDVPSPETEKEFLKEMLKSSGIVAHTWVPSGELDVRHHGDGIGDRNLFANYTNRVSVELAEKTMRTRTDVEVKSKLRAKGVAEIFTFTSLLKSSLAQLVPGHGSEPGPLTIVTYETTIGDIYNKGPRYTQGNSYAPGVKTSYHLFMSPTNAADLETAVRETPRLVHELTDTLMQDTFGITPKTWKELGPQYEAWKDLNGGVNRIAVRNGIGDTANKADILEF